MMSDRSTVEPSPKRHKCLFVAHTFPPIAAVGIYRTLRFMENLPDFGWEGMVLSMKEEAVVGHPIDHSLCSRIPAGAIVERVGVWRLLDRGIEWIKRICHPRKNNSRQPSADTAVAAGEQQQDSPRGFFSGIKRRLMSFREIVFYTPDDCANWIGPAVIAGCRMVRQHRPQVIVSTGPPHSVHLAGLGIRLLTRTPLVLDLRDPWACDEWRLREDPKVRNWLQKRMESLCVRFASRVVLNTERLKREFIATYPKKYTNKFVAIPNGVDDRSAAPIQQYLQEAREGPPGETPILCHPGSIYRHRSLQPLIDAVEQLKASQERVLLEQIGEVDDPPDLAARLLRRDLPEVKLWGQQSHETTLRRMAAADILIVIQPLSTLQVPAKLYEMLLFQKPILVLTGEGATADLIREYRVGMLADPNDPAQIAQAIRQMLQMLRKGGSTGDWERARAAYDTHHLTGKLAAVLDGAIGRSG